MTEDDTFNKLVRTPFKEFSRLYARKRTDLIIQALKSKSHPELVFDTKIELEKFCQEHHWTNDEFLEIKEFHMKRNS